MVIKQINSAHLNMIQHELLLHIVRGTVGAFEHRNFVIDDMLVEVRVEQRLLGEHRVTHGTLVDHPERERESEKELPIEQTVTPVKDINLFLWFKQGAQMDTCCV